jgi:glycosyltransferase involved in cell wall biosynthesis
MASRIFIVFHGRFPSEKAAALFVAENARSFAKYAEVTIVVPQRFGRDRRTAGEVYDIPPSIHVVFLPVIDLFPIPLLSRIGFAVSIISFTIAATLYLARHANVHDWVFSNDLIPGLTLSSFGKKVLYEVHDYPEHLLWLYHALFRRVSLVLATNSWKENQLCKDFPEVAGKIIMERNGVDLSRFGLKESETECRKKLSLAEGMPLVVYTGHLYGWKGIATLSHAATLLPNVRFYLVGGSPIELTELRKQVVLPPNVTLVGQVPHAMVPLWQGAADILVLPNTATENISARYTSPMKLFEYMASERPIVASRLPAITELLSEKNAFTCEPDDPALLATTLHNALQNSNEGKKRARAARDAVESLSWDKRAARLYARMNQI